MDPNECIKLGLKAIDAGDYSEAQEHLDNYNEWLSKGGFPADERSVKKLRGALNDLDKSLAKLQRETMTMDDWREEGEWL